jgi:hypothetical protein
MEVTAMEYRQDNQYSTYEVKHGGKTISAAPGILDEINQHVDLGASGDSFTEALLRNDLSGAFFTADDENSERIYAYVRYLHWHIPGNSWGSTSKVKEWRKLKKDKAAR